MESNTENINDNNNNENTQIEQKKTKVEYPKRKFALIHGYFGHEYCGNQKNPDVKTVEDELEKVLYKLELISECNYGVLQKIGWSRASRTDKRVSALFNVISCKLHRNPQTDNDQMKNDINALLPKDIKIFRIIEVSKSFDAKDSNNNREYHYILPSFCLEPRLNKSSSENESIDTFQGNYNFKITPEFHEKITHLCQKFKGTRKYHNYSSKVDFKEASANRHIYDFVCDELIEFKDFQAIKFRVTGQSFLYNQIRKMIGSIIDVLRDNKSHSHIDNSFYGNKVDIPKAPGEGLYLYNIDYTKYNMRKLDKKNNIELNEAELLEMEDFRKELVNRVGESESIEKVFSKWLFKYDNMRDNLI